MPILGPDFLCRFLVLPTSFSLSPVFVSLLAMANWTNQISCLCSIKSIEAFNIGNLSWMEIKEAAGTTRQVRGLGFKLVC